MSNANTREFTVRDVLQALFRHRRRAALVAVAVMVLVAVALVVLPKRYESEARLYVRLGRQNVALDATTTLDKAPNIAIPHSREEEFNTIVEIVRSRTILEQVVREVGPENILGCSKNAGEASWLARLLAGETAAKQARLEFEDRAIEAVLRDLNVFSPKDSNLVHVLFECNSPDLAQQVVQATIDTYLLEHARLHRTQGADDFLAGQTARVKSQLSQTESELAELRQQTGLASIDPQKKVLIDRIDVIQSEVFAADARLAGYLAETSILEDSVADIAKWHVTGNTPQGSAPLSDATSTIRSNLYMLQMREQALLSRFTENHIEVKQVRAEIEGIQRAVAAREPPSGEASPFHVASASSATGKFKPSEQALIRREPALAATESRAATLRLQLQTFRERLGTLTANETRIRQLEREIAILAENYQNYAANLEQANIDRALANLHITNINVVQRASIVYKPSSPNRRLILSLGVFVALFSAAGTIAVSEYFDHTFKTPEELERHLGLPVLAALPETV